MRIIGGEFGGRRIHAPAGPQTRPTSDRVREALFSMLESRAEAGVVGGTVLDAYAGSGALGLEALSRGATHAVFVERSRAALGALDRNVRELGVEGRVTVVNGDVRSALRSGRLSSRAFSLILLDPPYRIDRSEVRVLIEALHASGSISDGAIIVWEHSTGKAPDWPDFVAPLTDRRYGSTMVSLGEAGRTPAG